MSRVGTTVVPRVPPQVYFVGSAVFHYLGPAFAVLLFARVEPLGVAWLRIASAALIFTAWRRPLRVWRGLDRRTRLLLAAWAVVLAVMNSCFYLAIDRLPLGTVAAIEFLPVIAVAALGTRTGRNVVALVLAVAGVAVLSDVRLVAAPLAFATANAVLFACYIVLGHRVAQSSAVRGIDGLALAMLIAAVIALPLGIGQAVPAFGDPVALAAGVGVVVTSSVIPYVCDQLAMARLTRGAYALMVALLPATATVIGAIVLVQIPTVVEVLGVGLVVGGVGAALRSSASDLNLFLAVDMPFVQKRFLKYLVSEAEKCNAQATVPRAAGNWQPLCAVYRKAFADLAEPALRSGRNKIDALFREVPVRLIAEDELERAGFAPELFRNLNTPEDLRAAGDALQAQD
jgi:inner membrane transporter RhtA